MDNDTVSEISDMRIRAISFSDNGDLTITYVDNRQEKIVVKNKLHILPNSKDFLYAALLNLVIENKQEIKELRNIINDLTST